MGIHGIYKEIGPGQRIALSKLAVDKFEETGRPLRIAIDISIWLFQIQASKGGTNPALRTFYYRLLRLISHSIHPLFVFDGPNKPPFKRSKRTGPNVASIPEFLAKQLLKQFGLVCHIAPGEAEAECALLQREGIVDAVLSEDVDTLMFGSGITLRNWSAEVGKSNKTPSHVNLYDAKKTKDGSGLDREGMILIALMSGGDYVPEGIPGCGPKIACEAARAGFGHELYKIPKKDKIALGVWREKLAYELRTNESKFFKCKHKALKIPDDFPNPDVLGYYTTPCVSPLDKVERLRQSLQWDQDINFVELRTFTGDAFDWTKLGGAKKFIRNLAPALLVKELRMRGQIEDRPSEDLEAIEEQESKFVAGIHGRRNHATTDGVPELRVSFTPHDLVPIDLTVEEPDDEYPVDDDSEEEAGPVVSDEAPTSPSKKRGPSTYDPTKPEKIWVYETYVKVGAPLKTQDWEASQRAKQDALDKRAANKNAPKAVKSTKGKKKAVGGPLDVFTTVIKPGQPPLPSLTDKIPSISSLTMSIVPKEPLLESGSQGRSQSRREPVKKPSTRAKSKSKDTTQVVAEPQSTQQNTIIDLLSSPPAKPCSRPIETHSRSSSVVQDLSSHATKRRRSPLRRSQTDTAVLDMTEDLPKPTSVSFSLRIPASLSPPLSPSQRLPMKRTKRLGTQPSLSQKPATPSRRKRQDTVDLCSSPARQTDITNYFTPSKVRHADTSKENEPEHSQRPESPSPVVEALDLTMSPVRSSKRAPPTPSDLGKVVRIRPRPAQNQFCMESHFAALPRIKPSTSRPQPPAKPPITFSCCSPPPISQSPAELDLTEIEPALFCPKAVRLKSKANARKANPGRAAQSSIRRSPRFKSTVMHDNSLVTPVITAKRKQIIRVRDSIPGAFVVEDLDMTGDLPAMSKGKFRISGVGVLDLTGV